MLPRNLRPNSRGVLQPSNTFVKHGGNLTYYTKKVDNLRRLDRLIKEGKPDICVTRKSGGIGDVLCTLPVVKHISKKYDIKVDYGTDFDYLGGALVDVLKNNPYINRVIPWREVKNEDYDTVLDLTCPCVAHEKPKCKPVHRIDLFARHLGICLEDHDIDFVLSESEKEKARDYLRDNNLDRRRLILVQPSSSALQRDCPPDKLERAIARVLTEHRDVTALVISHGFDNRHSEWNIANVHRLQDFPFRRTASLLPHTELVVCPDSAWLHTAAAFHHPTLTLFGPTDPNARINYHPEAVAIWPGKELSAYPTWYETPVDGYLCWKRMDERLIAKSIVAMLDGLDLPPSRDFVTFGSKRVDYLPFELV